MAESPPPRPAVFAGLDVGKSNHHLCALNADGKRLADEVVANDEKALHGVLERLLARSGPVLLVVDQPASIGALPVAVARAMDVQVAYLPGLAMRRLADLHPGEGKTDARDAYVIADAARTLPHTLRLVGTDDETLAELSVLAGYDDDLAAETTRLSNRARDLLLSVSPALERVLGPRISHPAVLALLAAHPTPEALRAAGRRRLTRIVLPLAPRMGERLLDELLTALAEQTVVIPGTSASGRVLAGVARSLSAALAERRALAKELEDRLDAHPLGEVLTSMPGVGVRTAVKILTIVGDGTAFPTAAHLASYAGLAPVTRRSGSSIRGETRSQRGHRALKSALFLSAFASLSDPASRAYYDRKRKEGKRHNAALVCLARRRLDVLHAMLRTKTPYVTGGPKTNQEQPDRERHAEHAAA